MKKKYSMSIFCIILFMCSCSNYASNNENSEVEYECTEVYSIIAEEDGTQVEYNNPEEDMDSDYYNVATRLSRKEVEEYANCLKSDILSMNWVGLSDKILYPIVISGNIIENRIQFINLDFENVSMDFLSKIDTETCQYMFYNSQGICMGATGQIWFGEVINKENNSRQLMVIAINGLF